jgi:hypothetical protein
LSDGLDKCDALSLSFSLSFSFSLSLSLSQNVMEGVRRHTIL